MVTELFLNESSSKKSTNTSEGVDISFKGKRKLLPLNDFGDSLEQHL